MLKLSKGVLEHQMSEEKTKLWAESIKKKFIDGFKIDVENLRKEGLIEFSPETKGIFSEIMLWLNE